MATSPFRDDREALLSTIEALRRENEALGAEIRLLRSEVEHLRAATPENQQAFARRLQEDNDELRARVRELEPLEQVVRGYRRRAGRLASIEPSWAWLSEMLKRLGLWQ
jgi:predicted RNase H-like nuclease (RuvC/YqgF family)